MEWSIVLQYGWILVVLIILEGILAADNAMVLAVMVKKLAPEKRKKALFYGLAGAFIFRFAALFGIALLINVWQIQAVGALYLIFISVLHFFRIKFKRKFKEVKVNTSTPKKEAGFWPTVLKVEIADIAFAVDSILAAVALAVTLPKTSLPSIGGMDGGQFFIVLAGGLIGVILMRYAAGYFVILLSKKPGLEHAAYAIVGWVGIKLLIHTLSHPSLAVLPHHFASSFLWKITFYTVLIAIAVSGWFLSKPSKQPAETVPKAV
ncbi:TerC family protein [Alkalicoccus daliensis]|uniref:Integral membrane protein, YkoY family n=1 Tax=Alkalicoccus daliensis TaxID=745820 RepID=A0A1H0GWL3_9BACI|nr:TerC family protein [Alkalicoccus daliensis]SDO11238.1 integral membrane protein, YkoY family [Alkalicoccus daliensis]